MTNMWDSRFAQAAGYMYGERPNKWIEQNMPLLSPNSRVLALADGEGRNAVWLAKQGYRVENWDYSAVGLEKTQQLATSQGVTVVGRRVDLINDTLPENAQFDAIVSSFFHLPSQHQQHVWRNILSCLTEQGVLLVQVFSHNQLGFHSGGPKDLDLLYGVDAWQAILTSMKIDYFQEERIILDEGSHHQGEASVISIKARKG
ncbi:MAG: class I SAM-dependent methyltransferase [Proteobacteria bacterium]|jgi:hypothetical protein|nr:class I SAM-dependent methyltransferase [Pseudomonadota bacterium]